jgi:MFS family permease
MADLWTSDERGVSYGLVTFAPLLGVAVGPIIGGFITDGLGWPWLFWIVSMWDGFLVFLGIFLIHESYEPTLLAKKAKKLRESTGRAYYSTIERTHPTLAKKLKLAMIRPLRMLVTQPIVPLVSAYMAYHFGVYCLVISTFANVWTARYHQSVSTSGLHYIAIAVGAGLASQLGGYATDKVWAHLKAKAGGSVTPENRVPLMIPGALITPIGLFCELCSVATLECSSTRY